MLQAEFEPRLSQSPADSMKYGSWPSTRYLKILVALYNSRVKDNDAGRNVYNSILDFALKNSSDETSSCKLFHQQLLEFERRIIKYTVSNPAKFQAAMKRKETTEEWKSLIAGLIPWLQSDIRRGDESVARWALAEAEMAKAGEATERAIVETQARWQADEAGRARSQRIARARRAANVGCESSGSDW